MEWMDSDLLAGVKMINVAVTQDKLPNKVANLSYRLRECSRQEPSLSDHRSGTLFNPLYL
jgi:hypothetical protein